MTITEAIQLLKAIEAKHGSEVKVYFDCPNCKQAFTPGKVEIKTVVITAND